MLCGTDDWRVCESEDLPPRNGSCVIGFDLGGSLSMSAVVALWTNGRLEAWSAFPAVPDLKTRGQADGVGCLYEEMRERGELSVYAGRVVPVS